MRRCRSCRSRSRVLMPVTSKGWKIDCSALGRDGIRWRLSMDYQNSAVDGPNNGDVFEGERFGEWVKFEVPGAVGQGTPIEKIVTFKRKPLGLEFPLEMPLTIGVVASGEEAHLNGVKVGWV